MIDWLKYVLKDLFKPITLWAAIALVIYLLYTFIKEIF